MLASSDSKKKLNAALFVALSVAVCLVALTASCRKSEDYSDELFYSDVAWGIMTGIVDIYNQNVAGTSAGTIDITANGPFGGTVHITGTTSHDQNNDIETVHLLYDMSDCRVSSTASTSDLNVGLTLNGVISEDGSFSSTYTSLSYHSDALSIDGFSERGTREREIQTTTTFNANRTNSGTSAELCGYTVSW